MFGLDFTYYPNNNSSNDGLINDAHQSSLLLGGCRTVPFSLLADHSVAHCTLLNCNCSIKVVRLFARCDGGVYWWPVGLSPTQTLSGVCHPKSHRRLRTPVISCTANVNLDLNLALSFDAFAPHLFALWHRNAMQGSRHTGKFIATCSPRLIHRKSIKADAATKINYQFLLSLSWAPVISAPISAFII